MRRQVVPNVKGNTIRFCTRYQNATVQATNIHVFTILISLKNKYYPAQCVEKPSGTVQKSRTPLYIAVCKADLTTLSENYAFGVGVNPKPCFARLGTDTNGLLLPVQKSPSDNWYFGIEISFLLYQICTTENEETEKKTEVAI